MTPFLCNNGPHSMGKTPAWDILTQKRRQKDAKRHMCCLWKPVTLISTDFTDLRRLSKLFLDIIRVNLLIS